MECLLHGAYYKTSVWHSTIPWKWDDIMMVLIWEPQDPKHLIMFLLSYPLLKSSTRQVHAQRTIIGKSTSFCHSSYL
jgi:hypothetical protein